MDDYLTTRVEATKDGTLMIWPVLKGCTLWQHLTYLY